jgi:hypothetical protein
VLFRSEDFGLYTNLESMDDHWAARRYDDDGGDLWGTAASGADFDRANQKCDWCWWVLKSGEGDVSRLDAVKEAIDDAVDDFHTSLGAVIDSGQYLDYWAWNTVIGNGDGYPWTTNDVFVYADPDDGGRFDFSPWGMDESFNAAVSWSGISTRLGRLCTKSDSCTEDIEARICADIDAWADFDAAGFAQAMWELSQPLVETDPRREFDLATVEAGRTALAADIESWVSTVKRNNGCN